MPEPQFDYSREHDDPLAAELPPLVLDRQRVVHSAAFRRLLQKDAGLRRARRWIISVPA